MFLGFKLCFDVGIWLYWPLFTKIGWIFFQFLVTLVSTKLSSLFILFHRSPDLILGTSGESSCAESEKESTPAKLQPSADSDEVAEISASRESGQSRVPAVDDVVIIGEKKCQPASSTGDDASPKPNNRNENSKSDQVLISFCFFFAGAADNKQDRLCREY